MSEAMSKAMTEHDMERRGYLPTKGQPTNDWISQAERVQCRAILERMLGRCDRISSDLRDIRTMVMGEGR